MEADDDDFAALLRRRKKLDATFQKLIDDDVIGQHSNGIPMVTSHEFEDDGTLRVDGLKAGKPVRIIIRKNKVVIMDADQIAKSDEDERLARGGQPKEGGGARRPARAKRRGTLL